MAVTASSLVFIMFSNTLPHVQIIGGQNHFVLECSIDAAHHCFQSSSFGFLTRVVIATAAVWMACPEMNMSSAPNVLPLLQTIMDSLIHAMFRTGMDRDETKRAKHRFDVAVVAEPDPAHQ